jgi:hypothetical protein
MTEADYQGRIVEYASLCRWRLYSAVPCLRRDGRWRTSVTSSGWPDIIAVRGPVLAAFEVKTDSGRPSADQLDWLRALADVEHVTAQLVRPQD